MNQELIAMSEKWKSLERKTAKQREKADAFYETKLMKLVEKEFIENNREKIYENVEYLIMSVGTSYEPLVLDIQLLQPQRILFLYTEKTEYILEKIVRYCQLDVMRYSKREVDETEPLSIYKEIKRVYLKWNKPKKLYIDFTGGTKAMSAAAAMAGAVVNVQLIYVGTSEYLTDLRKPNPGTETLYYISNPMEIFGDLEIEKAFELFDKFNYAGASKKLEELKETVPDPDTRQQLSFVYHLAKTYEHWDALEFTAAYRSICILTRELQRDYQLNQRFLMMDFLHILKKQEGYLRELNDMETLIQQKKNMEILTKSNYMIPLMFTMYINAEIRREQQKYDMSTLLLYRLLEMIEQRRLALHHLYVSKMNYLEIHYNFERQPELKSMNAEERLSVLRSTVMDIKRELFRNKTSAYMPEQISLLDGFILLLALNDEICQVKSGRAIDKLKRIRAMVYLRNNSIFAHGLGAVNIMDFEKFRTFVIEIFKEFCEIESVPFEKVKEEMTWLNPLHSQNYAKMEE